jgi:hypothetical protein
MSQGPSRLASALRLLPPLNDGALPHCGLDLHVTNSSVLTLTRKESEALWSIPPFVLTRASLMR